MKPFCDGTHARINFVDAKDPKRVPDRRDAYPNGALTVFDNRGTCAHAGFCTDRLPTAFRAGKEPFVDPKGAGVEDIVRAVRACPSGALGHALDGREAPDQERPPKIEVSKNGPYRVTGAIPVVDDHDRPPSLNEGASRERYSLCRCGHSQNKPFCSGMHWYVRFRDPEA
jgi:CDGSH-type Zn-finger protein